MVIVNESGIYEIFVVAVWEVPTKPLLTLRIFKLGNIFNTCKVSEPIPTLLPTETESGIWDTYISVVAAPGDASDPFINEERFE